MKVRISKRGRAARRQSVVHACYDKPIAIIRVESAAPIAEPAFRCGELNKSKLCEIKGPDTLDGRSDLLAISANILHRRSAHSARNSGKAFDAGTILVFTARSTNLSQSSPAETSNTISIRTSALIDPEQSTCITKPPKPESETSKLLPPPSTNSAIDLSRAHAAASETSLSFPATVNHRAGPPIPSVVNGASGLFSSRSIGSRLHQSI